MELNSIKPKIMNITNSLTCAPEQERKKSGGKSQKKWLISFDPQKHRKKESEVTQSCPTLCDPIDCSLPGSSVHGIFQAIVLEWIAISFSRGSSLPRDRTHISCISCIGGFFTNDTTWEAPFYIHEESKRL